MTDLNITNSGPEAGSVSIDGNGGSGQGAVSITAPEPDIEAEI